MCCGRLAWAGELDDGIGERPLLKKKQSPCLPPDIAPPPGGKQGDYFSQLKLPPQLDISQPSIASPSPTEMMRCPVPVYQPLDCPVASGSAFVSDVVDDEARLEVMSAASNAASQAMITEHLQQYSARNPDASYVAWIASLHPENITVDHRMRIPGNNWLQVFNLVTCLKARLRVV